jgi:DNA-binding NtrC family response regulator
MNYDWPGNVREVRNAIERVVVTSADEVITLHDLPGEIRKTYRLSPPSLAGLPASSYPIGPLKDALDTVERELIRKALEASPNLAEAARILQIDLSTLTRKNKKYGLTGHKTHPLNIY